MHSRDIWTLSMPELREHLCWHRLLAPTAQLTTTQHHMDNLDVAPSPIDNNQIPAASFSELQFFTAVEGTGLGNQQWGILLASSEWENIRFTSCSSRTQSPAAAPPSFSSEVTDWSSQILTWGKKT